VAEFGYGADRNRLNRLLRASERLAYRIMNKLL
jgi:hypothetical protein